MRPSPLSNITVLDLTIFSPGCYATGVLGDWGAEVIKVESLPPIEVEIIPQFGNTFSPNSEEEAAWHPLNRNKKSIGINLRTKEGVNIFYSLVRKADVIIENFPPGRTKLLGIGYDVLKKINPRLIYCSITSYGQDGPYRDISGYDINIISSSGILSMMKGKGKAPPTALPLNFIADYGAVGAQAVVGILLALLGRSEIEKGQFVDISMFDATFSLASIYFSIALNYSSSLESVKNFFGGVEPYYNIYPTKDGGYISIAAPFPAQQEQVCRILGREDMIPLIPFQSLSSKEKNRVRKEWEDAFKKKPWNEWFRLLTSSGVSAAPVREMAELIEDPQLLQRGMILELQHPKFGKVKQAGIPIKLSATPGRVRHFAPTFSQNSIEILEELGYSKSEINFFMESGIIYRQRNLGNKE